MDQYNWKPIAGCPGRYILAEGVTSSSICELIGSEVVVMSQVFQNAPDPVSFCFFKGRGLIAYVKPNGFLHTLCNEEGMERKMKMLEDEANEE